MINLKGKTVTECCEIMLKAFGTHMTSEFLTEVIYQNNGPFVKVATVERKCRGSDKIITVPVPNKRWKMYLYAVAL